MRPPIAITHSIVAAILLMLLSPEVPKARASHPKGPPHDHIIGMNSNAEWETYCAWELDDSITHDAALQRLFEALFVRPTYPGILWEDIKGPEHFWHEDRYWGVHFMMLTREAWAARRWDFAGIIGLEAHSDGAVEPIVHVATDGRR